MLAALALASGCAALIYQLVWFQLLELVLGTSSLSLGVLLATFMSGLCIGGLLFWRAVGRHTGALRVYAALEVGIALLGVMVLLALPALASAYAALASGLGAGLPVRALVAGLCLLPPTLLMGATLPALGRALDTTPSGATALGTLYAANLAGAVAGCLLAGFYLLRLHDTTVATLVAVALNIAAAAVALAGAGERDQSSGRESPQAPPVTLAASAHPRRRLYAVIAVSGMTALAAEIVWTRQIALLLGPTVYTFSLILAVFLLALGLGSGAGALLSRRVSPDAALGYCQIFAGLGIGWGALTVARTLPYWPIDVTLQTAPFALLQLDLLRIGLVVVPAALCWGASVPLAIAAACAPGADPARVVGHVYAANTLGAIAGALGASFVLIALLGSQLTQQLMMLTATAAGAWLLARSRGSGALPIARSAATLRVLIVVAGLAATAAVPRLPAELIAYGRFMPTRATGVEVLYAAEGRSASIAVTRDASGAVSYHSAGKSQASTHPQDMRLQRMLGHLTTLVADEPRSVLVIGLGSGITAGAVAIDPAVERVVVAEVEPLVARAVPSHFAAQNHALTASPKLELVLDDGRHFLATTSERFEGITSDPLDPWVKGAAALYTVEFWRLVRARLAPGGVVTVFVQLYETTEAAVQSEIATFLEVFPHGAVFGNTVQGSGYDVVLLARAEDAPIDVDRLERLLQSGRYAAVAQSLREVGFRSATDLLGTFAGNGDDLRDWLRSAPLNRDRNLRLQYLAGAGLNRDAGAAIFSAMAPRAPELPAGLFHGEPARLARLRETVRAPFAPR